MTSATRPAIRDSATTVGVRLLPECVGWSSALQERRLGLLHGPKQSGSLYQSGDPVRNTGPRTDRRGANDLQNAGFDFAQLSSDSGGFIYALNVFYAGPRVNRWSQGLWPHAWALASPFQATATKKFNDYQITDMGAELTIGTSPRERSHGV